jgi:putative transposase
MKVCFKFKGISGIRLLMNYISNIAHMSKKDQSVILQRVKIIEFFDKFGAGATDQAFEKKRSTVFLWKQKLKQSGGKLSSLKQLSKVPKTRSRRVVQPLHISFVEQYRSQHPGVSKVTVKPALDAYCRDLNLPIISESAIGRVIKELKDKGRIPNYRLTTTINGKTGELRYRGEKPRGKKLRIGKYKPDSPGDLVQIDAIEIFINSIRRYIVTAIDVKTKFAFAYSYKTLSSNTARDFMSKLIEVTPFDIKRIQTDNGKEFHKYFREYVKGQNIVHFYNYPRSPKMNKYVERFNRTIQEQHVSWHMADLYEPRGFNPKLMQYLTWYNTEKPHISLNKLTPLQYYLNNYILDKQQSNMLWTTTMT